MIFEELSLSASVLKAVAKLEYKKATPVQEKCIPVILERKDVIANAQTGTGKTAAFALPIIQLLLDKQDAAKRSKTVKSVILSPTRELALQIKDNFKAYAKFTNLRVGIAYGGVSIVPQIDAIKRGVDIIIATPGRLLDLKKRNVLSLDKVEILVLDEADMMLDMGFIDDINKVVKSCPQEKQTLLFSATLPMKIVALGSKILIDPVRISIEGTSSAKKVIEQALYYVPKPKKMELCLHLLRNTIKGKIIIFRRTKFGVDKLEKSLVKNGYKVSTIHGDKSQPARQKALADFKDNLSNILIGTDVASRGIDIAGLDAVINFDMPNVAEIYIHRIGRTGRAGEIGKAFSFCSADELNYAETIRKAVSGKLKLVDDHPYPLDPKTKSESHKKLVSKNRKGRKSAASKKNKKRWY